MVCSVPEGVSYGHTFRGITRDLRDASVAIENRILEIAPRRARDAQADGLSLPAQHHYLYISRIRCLNNRPFNHEKIYLDLSFFPGTELTPQAPGAYVALFVIKRHKRLGDRKVEAILPSADLCENCKSPPINRCYPLPDRRFRPDKTTLLSIVAITCCLNTLVKFIITDLSA